MAFSVQQILDWTQGKLVNSDELDSDAEKIRVEQPAPLKGAKTSDIAFFFSKEYQHELPHSAPGVLITAQPFVGPLQKSGLPLWKKTAVVSCADPYLAMALVSEQFAKAAAELDEKTPVGEPQIHATAVVHDTAQVGAGTVIEAGCVVGENVRIGERCHLFPRVTVYDGCEIGSDVRLHSGVVVGADGFGYAPKMQGRVVVGHQKIYHLGRVVIGNDVEIGANSCIDRGTFGDTVLEDNVKIDNLVQVGHNARVEQGAVICGGVALAGTTRVGKYAYIGGLAGVSNKVHVGDYAKVGAMTLVTKDVETGKTAVGNPQREHREHFRAHAALNKMVQKRK